VGPRRGATSHHTAGPPDVQQEEQSSHMPGAEDPPQTSVQQLTIRNLQHTNPAQFTTCAKAKTHDARTGACLDGHLH